MPEAADQPPAPADQPPEPELSIIVPVYNEGAAVIPVLRALSNAVRTAHEILVVYDFDADTTVPAVRSVADLLPAVRLHHNDLGRGVLNAMKAGIAAARAPYVLVSMADGSDEPGIVDLMVALARDGADVVAASRYMRGGRQIGGPRLKRLMSRTAGLTLHWFGGLPIHDPTNNFKLYSRRFLDTVTIESTAGFELALELSIKAALAGRRLAEVPTTWRDRTAGQSNFRLRAWLPHYVHWYVAAIAGRVERLPGLRIVSRFGFVRGLRLAAASWFLALLITTPLRGEFLLTPGTIGNDVSNYLASGERLNAGHDLYRLQPGDRLVPTYPPYYVVPLVSPPPIAVLWRLLALLPEQVAVYGWWLGGLFGTVLTTLWLVRRGSGVAQLLVIFLAGEIAWTAWSGNVNAYVLPLLAIAWAWQRRSPTLAGACLALAVAGRLTPILVGWWAVVTRQKRLVVAGTGALLILGIASLAGAGITAHLAWLDVARYTLTTGARDESLIGILKGIGVPAALAGVAGPAFVILWAGGLSVLHHRPRAGWVLASIGIVLVSPVVHAVAPALAVLAAAVTIEPLAATGRTGRLSDTSAARTDAQAARPAQ